MKSHGMAVFTLTLIAAVPVPADALQTTAQNNLHPDSDYIRAKADRDGDSQISRDEVQYLHGTGDGRGAWLANN